MHKITLTPNPVIEAYKLHVDRSLLQANRRLTVEERIRKLMQFNQFAAELRQAGQAAKRKQ